MTEGDVLYVPRGFLLQATTPAQYPSLHLVFKVPTFQYSYRDALLHILDCCLCDRGTERLQMPVGHGSKTCWRDIMEAAIKVRRFDTVMQKQVQLQGRIAQARMNARQVGADVTPDLREIVPISPTAESLHRERHYDYSLIEELRTRWTVFFTACDQVFFEPFVGALREEGSLYAPESVVRWAEAPREEDAELFESSIALLKTCANFERAEATVGLA
mmetsp:Transcript_12715/g.38999  ORF Transcript_12715/g.38999 Transcript_12715/m.38999 type:complete len:217 (-) Transcript_12715:1579-2229(-)